MSMMGGPEGNTPDKKFGRAADSDKQIQRYAATKKSWSRDAGGQDDSDRSLGPAMAPTSPTSRLSDILRMNYGDYASKVSKADKVKKARANK